MYIKVRVTADAKKENFEKIDEDTYKVSVKEKAERNQANIRVRNLLAEKLDIDSKDIKIITGHHSPKKILFVENL